MVEFLGQLEGGRWLVRLESKEDQEDLSSVLVENKLCVSVSEPPVSFPELRVSCPAVPRGEMPRESCPADICHYDSPVFLSISPRTRAPLYSQIMLQAQSSLPGRVEPVLGTCCLASLQGEFHRAEITSLSRDQTKVSLFLIDFGKTIEEKVSSLKPLPAYLAQDPGLVITVRLLGVKPCPDEAWTEDKKEACSHLLKGEKIYTFHLVKYRQEECLVRAEDEEGNDLASQLAELELAELDDSPVQRPRPPLLPGGEQELLVLTVLSPLQLYLCSVEDFLNFTFLTSSFSQTAAEQAESVRPSVGDLVLAFKNGIWNRAEVVNVLINDFFQVDLFDFARKTNVGLKDIRRATLEAMEFSALTTRCGLHSFRGREDQDKQAQVIAKMKLLLKQLERIEVDVLESCE